MAYLLPNSSQPVMSLPKRLRLSDGLTRTNTSTLSDAELKSIGIRKVPNPPSNSDDTKYVVWEAGKVETDGEGNITSSTPEGWQIKDKSTEQLKIDKDVKDTRAAQALADRWKAIRTQRDTLLANSDWAMAPEQNRVTLTSKQKTDVEAYRKTLRDLPKTYENKVDELQWPIDPLAWDERFYSFTNTELALEDTTTTEDVTTTSPVDEEGNTKTTTTKVTVVTSEGLKTIWGRSVTQDAQRLSSGVPTEAMVKETINEDEPVTINKLDEDDKPIQAKDINGDPKTDEDGNPVYEQVANPARITQKTIAVHKDVTSYGTAITTEKDRVVKLINGASDAETIKTAVDGVTWPDKPLNYNQTYWKNLYEPYTLAECKTNLTTPVDTEAERLVNETKIYEMDEYGNEKDVPKNVTDYRIAVDAERDRVVAIYKGKKSISTLRTAELDTTITWPTKPS